MDAESSPETPPSDAVHDAAVEESAEVAGRPVGARPNRRMRAATLLTVPALLAFVGSAVLFLVPVTNPGVQSCGSPAWFLLQAETDRPLVTNGGSALHGWDDARIRQAHTDRCSVQVADRAVPAGILLLVFWVLTAAAIVLGWTGRRGLRAALEVDRR